ncbi:MAG: hypothetical protein AAFU84_13525, partial [Cyanobacteria bacterium J06633_23]
DVRSGNAAISPFLDLAMQEELTNLMGRFEGALLHGYARSRKGLMAAFPERTSNPGGATRLAGSIASMASCTPSNSSAGSISKLMGFTSESSPRGASDLAALGAAQSSPPNKMALYGR